MKNYKQILEAIHRGINLALDDFDDEQVLNIKSKQVYNRDYTKEYLDLLRDEVVDLGLPSGTLWCKYNLGVELNLLSKPDDWYGNYYAWGELEPNKPAFNWSNYKFAWGGNSSYLTKYITHERYMHYMSVLDNLTELQPEDDAAYQFKKYHSFKFHIPTKEQCEELINYTNNYWINNYDPNKIKHNPENDGGIKGLNGRIFEGKNGNLIFIPAAGYRLDPDIHDDGSGCDLWSSSLNAESSNNAWSLHFYSDIFANNITIGKNQRCIGCSVRPVINL